MVRGSCEEHKFNNFSWSSEPRLDVSVYSVARKMYNMRILYHILQRKSYYC